MSDEQDVPVPPIAEPHVCDQCGRVLDYEEGVGFQHTVGDTMADHEPVPVPESQASVVVGRCDFCYADYPEWVLPARRFQVAPGHVSEGDWAACTECGRLIETNQWTALHRRARIGWERRHGAMPDEQAASLSRLYRLLRKHVAGSLQPNPALARAGRDTGRFGQGWKTPPPR